MSARAGALVASDKGKNYDGKWNDSAFPPVALPCRAHVSLHDLRRPRPHDLGSGCLAQCIEKDRACFVSCAKRFPDSIVTNIDIVGHEAAQECDATCDQQSQICVRPCEHVP